jgi:hypothetical protein
MEDAKDGGVILIAHFEAVHSLVGVCCLQAEGKGAETCKEFGGDIVDWRCEVVKGIEKVGESLMDDKGEEKNCVHWVC